MSADGTFTTPTPTRSGPPTSAASQPPVSTPARVSTPASAPTPEPRLVLVFVRLKLTLLRNGLRQSTGRQVAFIMGTVLGVLWAVLILAGLTLLRGDRYAPDALVVLFCALTLGWAFLPLFFSGGDETVDPTRLTLLPVRPRPLMSGLLAASLIGPGPLVTTIILAGAPAVLGTSAASVAVGIAAAALCLVFCVVLSRAVAAANARLLNSRRGRDLAVLSGIIVVIGVQAANLALQNISKLKSLSGVHPFAEVLRWIPPGSAAQAIQATRTGDYGTAVFGLGTTAVALVLAVRWWHGSLNRLMVTRDASTIAAVADENVKKSRASGLARFLPDGRVGAVAGRQYTYALRDPRAKMSWVIALFMAALVPTVIMVQGARTPFLVCASALMLGMQAFNQFGVDGPSFWTTLLATGTRDDALAELKGRVLMAASIIVPYLLLIAVCMGVVVGRPAQIGIAVGVALAVYGVLVGISSLVSVQFPYSMPQSGNPMQTVAPGQNGLATAGSFAGMFSSLVLTAPVIVVAAVTQHLGSGWPLLTLPIGAAYGLGLGWLGLRMAAGRMVKRLPEILSAVSRG